ncbi:MAG: ABC transporter permease [Candidatus Omnitrophota bacterium]
MAVSEQEKSKKDKRREARARHRSVLTIRPYSGWRFIDFRELWEYRELTYFFIWREIKLRYKQTVIGCAWAIIQPFFMMVVLSIFFGRLARLPSDGIPYPVFVYSALLPWTLFSESVTRSTNSLVRDSNILRKIYFPRVIAPLAGVFSPIVDFVAAFFIFIFIMLYYGYYPSVKMIFLPFFLFLAFMSAFGVSVWLSALSVKYRDIQFTVPFLVQLWFFASPVTYPSRLVPERFQALYGLNPMVGVIEGFRWVLVGGKPPGPSLFVSGAIAAMLALAGIFYFRRCEKTFADYV